MQSNLLQSQIALLDFQAARYLMTGEVPGQVGNDHPTGMPTSAYRTRDGYINVAAHGEAMWVRFCKALEREEWINSAEFAREPLRAQNRKRLNQEISVVTVSKASAEWIELLNAAGVPCGPIYAMDQVFADPQVQHLRAAATIHHAELGDIRVVNQAARLSRTPACMARATPELGEHTDEVLAELGYSPAEVASLRQENVV